MATIDRVTNVGIGNILSTKLLAINSVETAYIAGSGVRIFEVFNLGVYSVVFGGSSVLASSGGVIAASNGTKKWENVRDNFSVYFAVRSAGVTSDVLIHEY